MSSRLSRTRIAWWCSSASSAAVAGAGDVVFEPNAPALPSAEIAALFGWAHEASVSRYPGSVQVVCRLAAHSPAGRSIGWLSSRVVRRPWTLPASWRAWCRVLPTAHDPSLARTATGAPSGAESSAKPPRPSAISVPTDCATPPSTEPVIEADVDAAISGGSWRMSHAS